MQKPVALEKLRTVVIQKLRQTEDRFSGIDRQVLVELSSLAAAGGMEITEFFSDYLTDLPILLTELADALKANDLALAAKALHALKGMNRAIGAVRLAHLAEKAE